MTGNQKKSRFHSTFCMKQTHKCTNQQLARLAIASIYIVMQSARVSWLFWTSPKIAQTSWTFHKDPMLMVLHLKFKYRLRLCYLWSFSASILLQTFQYYDIFLHLLCSVCSRNSLQKRDALFILNAVMFKAEIGYQFCFICFQPDCGILDCKIW